MTSTRYRLAGTFSMGCNPTERHPQAGELTALLRWGARFDVS